jgi:hypothetical protein
MKVVHELKDLKVDKSKKYAIIDASDAGEVGYMFGYEPETVQGATPRLYNVLLCNDLNGQSYIDYWDEMLDTSGNLVIFNDPLTMCRIHCFETTAASYGADGMGKTLEALCRYLKKKEYQEIWILCSNTMSTAFGKSIARIKNLGSF